MADAMIEKLRNYFDEMVVYKDLKNSNFFSALSLPSFTRDWLLRKFEDEEGHFDSEELAEFVLRFIPRKNDWTAIKSRIVKDNERVRMLAKIAIEINIRTGEVSFTLPDFGLSSKETIISFTDVDEMRAALKGYLESGVFTVGNYEGTASSGVILCGNISKETMDNDGTTDMFRELPAVFHESALIERFHGFIKGWKIPRMTDDLKISGWALNSEYFCSILHELREDTTYRGVVDKLVAVPEDADTRDTEAVKRIATAYLKLLFPHVRKPKDIKARDFNRYCLRRACNMRATIKMQLGIMDAEYCGKDIPQFTVNDLRNV